MNKDNFLQKMTDYGDAVVTYRSPVSRRSKYVVGTTDFNSSDYIKDKRKPRYRIHNGSVLMFCWDTDTFKQIAVSDVQKIEPLSKVIAHGVR